MSTTIHRPITSEKLRTPPGPWSNAIEVLPNARYLYTCGLVGVRQDGTMEEGVEAQTVRIYENIKTLLDEANMDMSHVVKLLDQAEDAAKLSSLGFLFQILSHFCARIRAVF